MVDDVCEASTPTTLHPHAEASSGIMLPVPAPDVPRATFKSLVKKGMRQHDQSQPTLVLQNSTASGQSNDDVIKQVVLKV